MIRSTKFVRFTKVLGPLLGLLLLAGASPGSQGGTVVFAQTAEQKDLAAWALSRFDRASLALPPVEIQFAGRDEALCDGSPARAYLAMDPIQVRMCWTDGFMLLHELGHVWEAAHVPLERHHGFMALRDRATSWAGLDVPWDARGREHAANVIAWGLLEEPYPVSRTYPNDPATMIEAFRFLTGADPLHDGGEGIGEPDRALFQGRSSPPLESGR